MRKEERKAEKQRWKKGGERRRRRERKERPKIEVSTWKTLPPIRHKGSEDRPKDRITHKS